MSDAKIHDAGTADSWHGTIQADGPFRPEAGRYHLYIGHFCPFAHRVNLVRHLKGLTDLIDVSVVEPYPKGDEKGWPGWRFPDNGDEYPGATVDHLFGSAYLHDVYFKDDKDYEGRYSVPLLWDKSTNSIVNTESLELLRNLPVAFNELISPEFAKIDFYPEHLRPQIEAVKPWLSANINSGVYKAGNSKDQASYDKNVLPVFAALNKMEKIIASNGGPYVLGKHLTELDIQLYPTIIRFDVVYVQHFKVNLGTIRHDYPVIHNWLKNVYWNVPGFKETTNFQHIKENYTKSHYDINPRGITPMGPYPDVESGVEVDFSKIAPGGVRMPAVMEMEDQIGQA